MPVLSNTTVSVLQAVSSCSPPRNSTPSSAARPEPVMIEVGVASPSAQGQAITSVEQTQLSAERRFSAASTK